MNPERNSENGTGGGGGETRPDAESAWPRGDALDALLALDRAPAPDGLAERIVARTAAERRAGARVGERIGDRVGGATRGGRRWPLGLVAPVAGLAAAAALALYVALPGDRSNRSALLGPGPLAPGDPVADSPGDDVLAALPELEAYAFLESELDPLEEDALFLLDPADDLVLEILEEEQQ